MIALVIGDDVPLALVAAAGLQPRRAHAVELSVLLPGDFACVVFSHLRESHVRAYHRWSAELGGGPGAPALILLDLPATDSPAARTYGLLRLREFAVRLGAVGGVEVDEARLRAALADPPAVAAAAGSGFRPHEPAHEAVAFADDATGDAGTGPLGRQAVVLAETGDTSVVRSLVAEAGWRVAAQEGEAGYGPARFPREVTDPWLFLIEEHLTRVGTTSRASMSARAAALAVCARSAGATTVVMAGDPLDDDAAWLRSVLLRDHGRSGLTVLTESELVGGAFPAGQPPPATGTSPRPSRTTPADSSTRSRKTLSSTAGFGQYQREWFAAIQARARGGEPFAMVNADAPQEILRAMDIPFVVNQWWASIVAAKQVTRRYRDALNSNGFPAQAETYNSQGLADLWVPEQESAWGGLPRPDLLQAMRSDDAVVGIFEQWSRAAGAELVLFDRTSESRPSYPVEWWDLMPRYWDEVLEASRLDLMTEQLHESARTIGRRTGRRLEQQRLIEVLDLVNEQEEYYRRARDLIAMTRPAPVGIADTMPATMIPQWHRGTVWGRDAARAFYQEVRQRVDEGTAACSTERLRLMWVGRGTWQNMGLYQAFEESHGAVFVCSMYLSLAADGYLRYFRDGQQIARDPMRSLAARFITMGDELRMPVWSAGWHVAEARRHAVDAVVAIADAEPSVLDALEATGLPVLRLAADNLSLAGGEAARQIGVFLDQHFGGGPSSPSSPSSR